MKADNNIDEIPFLKKEIEKTVTNSKEWLIGKVNELIK